jgi:hypothetical protein
MLSAERNFTKLSHSPPVRPDIARVQNIGRIYDESDTIDCRPKMQRGSAYCRDGGGQCSPTYKANRCFGLYRYWHSRCSGSIKAAIRQFSIMVAFQFSD